MKNMICKEFTVTQICFIYYTLKNSVLSLARHLYISIMLLREGYALLKCFSLVL